MVFILEVLYGCFDLSFQIHFLSLPLSTEEVISAQQEAITLHISPSTHQTDSITMIIHQSLLYQRIKSEDGQQRLQLVAPKAVPRPSNERYRASTAGLRRDIMDD
ncbi:hypothetical protein QQF64_020517 [Cirrhinus molitorella]|uniref:Uncharacterized protein n=1 Tax=Cirrhinus molitorella TaxID=172907 RepID=A0ABR3L9E0_9TELE